MWSKILSWWKGIQRNFPLVLALLAALASVYGSLFDSYIVNNVVVASSELPHDRIIAVLVYQLWASIIALASYFIIPIFSKNKFDGEYKGFAESFKEGSIKMHLIAIVSGAFGALSIFAWLYANQQYDGSITIPLASLTIVVVMLIDWLYRKTVAFRAIWFPVLLSLLGTFLVAYAKFIPSSGPLDGLSQLPVSEILSLILLLVVGRSFFKGVGNQLDRSGAQIANSSLFSMWRFLWFTVVTLVIVFGYLLYTNSVGEFFSFSISLGPVGFLILLIRMTPAYFLGNLSTMARKHKGTQLTNVTIVMSLDVAIGFVFIWLLSLLGLEPFGHSDWSPTVALFKVLGVALIVTSVVMLRLRQPKNEKKG